MHKSGGSGRLSRRQSILRCTPSAHTRCLAAHAHTRKRAWQADSCPPHPRGAHSLCRGSRTHTNGHGRLTAAHHPRGTPPTVDGELYQGHRGPGIGFLADSMPERRDRDKDTVVAERRPRKADTIRPSPAPVPERHRPGAADWLGMVEAKMLTQHNFHTRREEGPQKHVRMREEADHIREVGPSARTRTGERTHAPD